MGEGSLSAARRWKIKEKALEERRLAKIREVSLSRMSSEQKRLAERLYQQLGLDPVVDKVLKSFADSLPGVDRILDKMFGPYDIKGRAEAVAKVTALITYAALGDKPDKETGKPEAVTTRVEPLKSNHEQLRLL